MRIFEFVLVLTLGLSILRVFYPWLREHLPSSSFELVALLVLSIHLGIERYRWQMLPTYILIVLFLGMGWLRYHRAPALGWPKGLRIVVPGMIGLLALGTTFLPILLPVPHLTAPAGEYGVGTRSWHWIDTGRTDPYAPGTNAPREIMAQAWYPIEKDVEGARSPWMDAAEIVAPAVAGWINLPPFFLNHLVLVSSQALQDTEPASGKAGFPLLLFSHGYGGFRAQNTNQMQHLASHGFVVLAVEHTYGAVVSVFPDGRVASHNPDTLPDGLSPAEDLAATRALGIQWAGDLAFALDRLTLLSGDTGEASWLGVVDLTRIGAFGHSTGGGAAIEFCARDARCSATLTLDPFVKPVSEATLEAGLPHLALHMFSETWASSDNLGRFSLLARHSAVDPVVVHVIGSGHYDFSDLPLLTPLAHQLGLKGPINGPRMADIVNAYLLDYFNLVLREMPSILMSGPTLEYPEVHYRVPPGDLRDAGLE